MQSLEFNSGYSKELLFEETMGWSDRGYALVNVPLEMQGATLLLGKYRHVGHGTVFKITPPVKSTIWCCFTVDRGQSGRFQDTLKNEAGWEKMDEFELKYDWTPCNKH